jgi:hypothetical protein
MHKLCVAVVAAFGISAFVIPAFAEDLPVSLSKGCQVEVLNSAKCPQIRITGRANNTTIRKVVANRGNCLTYVQQKTGRARYYSSGQFYDVDELVPLELPHSLVFGEALFVGFSCDPIEVEVTTDQDSFIFTFDE